MAEISDTVGLPTIAPQSGAPADYSNVRATPQAFGAGLGVGLKQLGEAAEQAGTHQLDIYNKTAADQSFTQLQGFSNDLRNGVPGKTISTPDGGEVPDTGVLGLRGAEAMRAAPDAIQQIKQKAQTLRDALPSEEARREFDETSRRELYSWENQLGTHARDQQDVWAKAANADSEKQALTVVASAPTDMASIAEASNTLQRARLRRAQLDYGNILTPDQTAEIKTSSMRDIAATRVRALAPSDPVAAYSLLQKNAPLLASLPGGEYDRLADVVRARAQDVQKGDIATETLENAKVSAAAPPSAFNLGNVKIAGGVGFQNPASPVDGVILTANNLRSGYQGLTIGQIAEKWAPKSDGNDPAGWAQNVSRASGLPVNTIPNMNDPAILSKLLGGIATAEKSVTDRLAFTPQVIANGVQAALSGQKASLLNTPVPPTNLAAYYRDNYTALTEKARAKAEAMYPGDTRFADAAVAEVTRQANQVITHAEQQTAGVRLQLHSVMSDATAMIEHGIQAPAIPSDEQIESAFPESPERALEMKQTAAALRDMNEYTGSVPTATPQQVQQMLLRAQPDPAKPDYAGQQRRFSALSTVLKSRADALGRDPATYIIGAQRDLQPLFNAATQDPTKFPAYALAMQSAQTAIGIPTFRQHVLPQAQARSIAQSITSNPAAAVDRFAGLQKQFRQFWPQAFKDVSTIGGLDARYQALASIPAKDGFMLARVLGEGAKDGKSVSELLPPKDAEAIRDNVKAQLTGLRNSLAASQLPAQQIEAIEGAAVLLGHGNAVYGAMPIKDAADAAVKAFTGNYTFMGAARMPSDRADTVQSNARARLDALSESNVQAPAARSRADASFAGDYIRTLKGAPTWITSPSEDALWLVDMGGRVVKDKQGHPVAVGFKDPPVPNSTKGSREFPPLGGTNPFVKF